MIKRGHMHELNIIKDSSILEQKDFEFLACISEELRDALSKRQIFRTETEMEISVLNDIKFPNPASKYWQAVREQMSMFENLVIAGFDYRRNEIKIRRLEKKINESNDEFDREELLVDLDECLFKRTNLELTAKDRIREIRLWSQIKQNLNNGSFDTTNVNNHQLVSYAQRFILQASNAPADMPVAEANNLKGQLITALRECESKGQLEAVLNGLSEPIVKKVLIDTGLLQISSHNYEQIN